jgi:Spy/CpxP family protein refolding chaperone
VRRWWILIGLLLSLGVNAGILATLGVQHFRGRDQPRPEQGGAPPTAPEEMRPNLAPLADRLGVTGEARQRFLATQEQFVARMREGRFRLMQLQAELRAELLSERPDRSRIDATTRQLGEAYAAQDGALAESILAARDVLTPVQQERFLTFVEARLHQLRGGERALPGMRPRLWPPRRRFDRPNGAPGGPPN